MVVRIKAKGFFMLILVVKVTKPIQFFIVKIISMKMLFYSKIQRFATAFILMISIGLAGCNFNVSTAKVVDAKICADLTGNLCEQDNPELPSSVSTIFSSCLLKNATPETKVKFTWIYYGDTKFEIDNVVLDTEDKSGDIELNSSLSRPNNGWPNGVYEVIIQVQTDNSEPLVKQFNIN